MPDIETTPQTPIPTPYVRYDGGAFDDEGTFTGAPPWTRNVTTGALLIDSAQSVPVSQQDGLATAIEKCFYVNLSGSVDLDGFVVEGDPGATPPVPDIKVDIISVSGALAGIKIGAAGGTSGYSPGKAWSVAHLIRSLGIGAVYTPPTP